MWHCPPLKGRTLPLPERVMVELSNEDVEKLDFNMDIHAIMKVLPHRAPFLMIDRVTGTQNKETIHGYKLITNNEPHFQGHFPGFPVFPGVLQIEALAQLGGLFAVKVMGIPNEDIAIYLLGVDDVRFRKMVSPGDKLDLKAWLIKRRGNIWRMGGEASVDGEVTCELSLMAYVGTREGAAKRK
jgi:3-hydroxyacyl-[acyl-carrier-protein] dehydratase